MARSREGRERPVDIWPGFVDALSTLLLSLIFLLVVFVLGQFFLGQLLQGRNETVLRLEGRMRDLDSQLESERNAASELRRSLSRLIADLGQASSDRDDLQTRLSRSDAERDRAAERAATLAEEQARLQRALGTLRGEAPSLTFDDWRTGDQRYYVSDVRAFGAVTGWIPRTGVAEGVERLHEWLVASRAHAPASHP